jgi:phage tail-like protein
MPLIPLPAPPLNLALTRGLSAMGIRFDPHMGFNFLVEIGGLVTGGFREVHGLEGAIEMMEYGEGGQNRYVHQLPGRARFPTLALSHGLTDIDTLYGWYDLTAKGIIRRHNVTILLMDRDWTMPLMWWDVYDALPVKWSGPALDAEEGGRVAVESVELAHRGVVKSAQSRTWTLGRRIGVEAAKAVIG